MLWRILRLRVIRLRAAILLGSWNRIGAAGLAATEQARQETAAARFCRLQLANLRLQRLNAVVKLFDSRFLNQDSLRHIVWGRRLLGYVLGNMLTNMFSGSHPQEIVNIIDEQQPQQQQDVSPALDNNAAEDPFRQQDDPFLADNNTFDSDFDAGFGNDDDFGSDDDSWV